MSPLMDLRIDAALDGKQEQFDRILAERAAEQHWSGRSGLGGDVSPGSRLTLHEVLEDRLDLSAHDVAEIRYAARKIRAACPDDPDMQVLASHLEAWEMFVAEQAGKELSRDMNTMESFLREHGVPMVEQRVPIGNAGSKQQHPRAFGWANYLTNIRPQTIDDREARGAREDSMSQKLRGLAMEVSRLAKLSSSPRQRNRLMQRAEELHESKVIGCSGALLQSHGNCRRGQGIFP